MLGKTLRFLHRCERKYYPILPPDTTYSPGNITDFLFLLHYRYFNHNMEMGYNPTYITDQAYKSPQSIQYLPSKVLHSIYGYYAIYAEKLSMIFELGLIGTFSSNVKAITSFGLIGYYF